MTAGAVLRAPQLRIAGRGWATPRIVTLLAMLAAAVPLLLVSTPPLIDLPNHMSRYRIALAIGRSPFLHHYYDFRWVLVGNLGVDLAVMPLAWAVGLEPAVKLVVTLIPMLTIAGMALVAREAHGRLPATAFLAFPFAFGWPFNYGFVNFCLSAGLALLAFGLWLRLGRLERTRLRAWLFGPIAGLVWIAHVSGWALLGLLIFASEAVARRDAGRQWLAAGWSAGLACLPLALPALGMLNWVAQVPGSGRSEEVAEVWHKLLYLGLSLRNRDAAFDVGSVAAVAAALALAIGHARIGFDRRLAACAIALALAYAIMPGTLMGAFYADMRLAPFVIALAVLAFAPAPGSQVGRALGLAAIALFAARMADLTAHYRALDAGYSAQLAALDHLPRGTRVFASAQVGCIADWDEHRMNHLGRMAVVRREAFVNGNWPPPGSQLLSVHPERIAGYTDQDSELLKPALCRDALRYTIDGALAAMPRGLFDYYWLIDVPPERWPQRDWLVPVWQGARGVLYRIDERRRKG